jgi:hypothetical protein
VANVRVPVLRASSATFDQHAGNPIHAGDHERARIVRSTAHCIAPSPALATTAPRWRAHALSLRPVCPRNQFPPHCRRRFRRACRGACAGRRAIAVTLIDRRNHHVFQPLSSGCGGVARASPDQRADPRCCTRQASCEVVLAEVTGVDVEKRRLLLAAVPASRLSILAAGAAHSYFGRRLSHMRQDSRVSRMRSNFAAASCLPSSPRNRRAARRRVARN